MRSRFGQVTGEAVTTIWRVFLVSFIALFVLGISTISYSYNIEVGDIEATILSRSLANCLIGTGEIVIENLKEVDLLEQCGYSSSRLYVRANFLDESGESLFRLESGNTGAIFVNQLSLNADLSREEVYRVAPGYSVQKYPAVFDGEVVGEIEMEVIILDEE